MDEQLSDGLVSGLVTVRVSDHLPVYLFVGGDGVGDTEGGKGQKRRLVNEGRIARFAGGLSEWCFDVVRSDGVEGNVARFKGPI